MIIGSKFNYKNQKFLEELARLSDYQTEKIIAVKKINKITGFDRIEVKNILEHLEELGFIQIQTIGGPWLYGHVSITQRGLHKIDAG